MNNFKGDQCAVLGVLAILIVSTFAVQRIWGSEEAGRKALSRAQEVGEFVLQYSSPDKVEELIRNKDESVEAIRESVQTLMVEPRDPEFRIYRYRGIPIRWDGETINSIDYAHLKSFVEEFVATWKSKLGKSGLAGIRIDLSEEPDQQWTCRLEYSVIEKSSAALILAEKDTKLPQTCQIDGELKPITFDLLPPEPDLSAELTMLKNGLSGDQLRERAQEQISGSRIYRALVGLVLLGLVLGLGVAMRALHQLRHSSDPVDWNLIPLYAVGGMFVATVATLALGGTSAGWAMTALGTTVVLLVLYLALLAWIQRAYRENVRR